MYCRFCGNPLPPGTSFCPVCGAPAGTPDQPAVPIQPGQGQAPPGQRTQPGGNYPFWKTPGGIITIIFISVFVIGSLIAGLVFAFSGSGGGNEKSINEGWTRLNDVADEIDSELEPVMNLESIGSATQIKDFRELLDDADSDLYKVATDIKSLSLSADEKESRDSLLETVESFQLYLNELDKFLGIFTEDPADTKLDTTLDEMSALTDRTLENSEDFTHLDPGVIPSSFNTEALNLSSDYVTQLAAVRKATTDKKERETGQDTVEAVNDARKSIENILSVYVGKGWGDIVQYMTPALYAEYAEAYPPWSQVSYTVESANITNFQVSDENTIVFTVKEQHSEDGDITTETGNWEMVKSGDDWLLNNTPYTYN